MKQATIFLAFILLTILTRAQYFRVNFFYFSKRQTHYIKPKILRVLLLDTLKHLNRWGGKVLKSTDKTHLVHGHWQDLQIVLFFNSIYCNKSK